MATWANVCEWRPEPLEESAENLRTMHGTLTHLREDAQLTLARIASRGEAVDAARAALRTCITSHGEHIDVVTRLMTATREAGDGVAAVRRKALACLDYADAHPQVVLGPDGAVTVAPTASGTSADGARRPPMAAPPMAAPSIPVRRRRRPPSCRPWSRPPSLWPTRSTPTTPSP